MIRPALKTDILPWQARNEHGATVQCCLWVSLLCWCRFRGWFKSNQRKPRHFEGLAHAFNSALAKSVDLFESCHQLYHSHGPKNPCLVLTRPVPFHHLARQARQAPASPCPCLEQAAPAPSHQPAQHVHHACHRHGRKKVGERARRPQIQRKPSGGEVSGPPLICFAFGPDFLTWPAKNPSVSFNRLRCSASNVCCSPTISQRRHWRKWVVKNIMRGSPVQNLQGTFPFEPGTVESASDKMTCGPPPLDPPNGYVITPRTHKDPTNFDPRIELLPTRLESEGTFTPSSRGNSFF